MPNTGPGPDKQHLSIVGEPPPPARLRILLVDVDDAEAATIRREFAVEGSAQLDLAADCETAKQMALTQIYDLVAVDPVLPGGFDLLKHIKDTQRWVATMVVTGDQSPQALRQAVKCRIDGLLFKPGPAAEFVEQALLLANAVSARREVQQKRVLAIGAHPDDVEIGCGGTLAKHRANGDLLRILTLSRGAAGGDVNQRVIEARRAAELLGATLEIANLPDTRISAGTETIDIIQAEIRALRPTHIYTHCVEDTHQDHRAIHTATLVAARRVPNVYCYQTPSTTVDFQPNRFVDISDFIKEKIRVIDAYKSQVERMDALEDDLILATARYWGRFAGYVLAEPLRIIRQRDSDMQPDSGGRSGAAESASVAAE